MKTLANTITVLILLLCPSIIHAENRNEKAEVERVTDEFFSAWNRHDATAIGNLYAQDADFINVIGMHLVGREAITQAHIQLHAGRMKSTHVEKIDSKVRFLPGEVAIVINKWSLKGDTGAPDWKNTDNRTGIMTHVLAKSGAKWLISATQNTDIVPIPNN